MSEGTLLQPMRAFAALPGELTVDRLDNGLTVGRLINRQAPVVTSALWYRVGTRDEPDGHGGIAHFLEHMMFKGSRRYRPGEIDRRTQALGGINNAYTSHDFTVYYFNFASDRYGEALAIEADRMAGLSLDPAHVASERQVILEELAMYDSDPWDALFRDVERALFPDHPYGRPVLGSRDELLATGGEALAEFHRRYYQPGNAVLVLAGDLGDGALEAVEAHFAALPGADPERPHRSPSPGPDGLVRIERRMGEVARLLLALPGPAAGDPAQPAVRLLGALLTGGRSSRLHRALVDEGELASWVSGHVTESLEPGAMILSAELLPGVEPERVEQEVLEQLARLAGELPEPAEVERARRILLADWVFGHERIYQQSLVAGFELSFFDPSYAQDKLDRLRELTPEALGEVAKRWLQPQRSGVVGWSHPREESV